MNRPSNTALTAVSSTAVLCVVAAAFVLFPAWQSSELRASESGRLLARASQLDLLTHERDAARSAVESARERAETVVRTIPRRADQGALMRMLAIDAGDDVGTQTILAGEAVPASTKVGGYLAMPVTVEMNASFARVMEILSRAENDRKLVRPIRIEIKRPADGARSTKVATAADRGFVEARIELDAVYGTAVAASEETE